MLKPTIPTAVGDVALTKSCLATRS
ncbi:hypothetical protein M8C21_005229 [Ambrosia artemisiifolia]|uniref:Uncharacterized protein n=1 Tax=Ambrosia artemisiifolia TaxID=4212 RepID=A0AAD5CDE1_AMBAR|nr:hypothetical protein M8C21_005229 [Ambrosia artemisiifolia]